MYGQVFGDRNPLPTLLGGTLVITDRYLQVKDTLVVVIVLPNTLPGRACCIAKKAIYHPENR